MNSYEIGVFGENAAEKYLRKQKYKIVSRNFKTVFGEIDIIARKGEEIVFVEVKTRSKRSIADPVYYVDQDKIRHMQRAIGFFMSYYKCEYQPRIDVIEVYTDNTSGKYVLDRINHIKNILTE